MEDIIKLLPVLLRQSQYNEEVCERASFAAWRNAAGEAIVRVSVPQRLVRKTLYVAVIDETWKKQLDQISSQILFKLNKLFGTPLITNIEFSVDAQSVKAAHPTINHTPEDTTPTDTKLLAAAEKIKDDDLRDRFLATAGKYLAAQKEHFNK